MAVLLVVALHVGILLRPRNGGFVPGGFVGVDVFFVLSGFLITSLLLGEHAERGRVSFRSFYARRALRLLPALVVFLVGHMLYAAWADISMRTEAKSVLAVLFYVSNWVQSYGLDVPGGLIHTWTLSIEEQFYLIWPIAFLLLLRYMPSRRALFGLIGVGILASAAIRAAIWAFGAGFPAAYMRTDARADGLLIGVACAFLWRWKLVPQRGLRAGASASLVALLALALLWESSSPAMFYGGYTVVSLAAALIILAVMEGGWKPAAIFDAAALRAVGRVSYGLYLWQGLSLHIAARAFPEQSRPVLAVVGVTIAALATFLSWRYVEQPFLRLKDRRIGNRVVDPIAEDLIRPVR